MNNKYFEGLNQYPAAIYFDKKQQKWIKKPQGTWKKYQSELYPPNLLINAKNLGVFTGKISNNLAMVDFDFKPSMKKFFKEIFNDLKESELKELLNTYIEETVKGVHFYWSIKDKNYNIETQQHSNAGYEIKKGKYLFDGVCKTKYQHYLSGLDIRGEGGFSVIAPSKYDLGEYKILNDVPIKEISKEEYISFLQFFLHEKPKTLPRYILDVLNGNLELHQYAKENNVNELLIIKCVFFDCYHFAGIDPKDLFKGLEANQPNFSIKKTEEQLKYHYHQPNGWFIDKNTNEKIECKPFSTDTRKEIFPTYYDDSIPIPKKTKEKLNLRDPKILQEYKDETKKDPYNPNGNLTSEYKKWFKNNYVTKANIIVKELLNTHFIYSPKEYKNDLLVYKNGVYIKQSKEILSTIIFKYFEDHGYFNVLTEREIMTKESLIKKIIFAKKLCSINEFDNYPNLINIGNGIVNFDDFNLLEHDPKYKMTIQIPTHFTKQTKESLEANPLVQYIREYGGIEHEQLIYEAFGDACIGKPNRFQKVIIFVGPPASGKSSILKILKAEIGAKNCSHESLHDLEENEFAAASLNGKLANIHGDLPIDALKSTEKYKILTGEDEITVNDKYGYRYTMKIKAKQFYSCNKIPQTNDSKDAILRRSNIIHCYKIIPKEKIEDGYIDKLCTPENLSGVFYLSLLGLKRLIERKRYDLKYSEDIEDQWDKFSNPLIIFMRDYIENVKYDGYNEAFEIDKDVLFETVNNFLEREKFPIYKNKAKLTAALKQLKEYEVSTRDYQKNGEPIHVYTYITFNKEAYNTFENLSEIRLENKDSSNKNGLNPYIKNEVRDEF